MGRREGGKKGRREGGGSLRYLIRAQISFLTVNMNVNNADGRARKFQPKLARTGPRVGSTDIGARCSG